MLTMSFPGPLVQGTGVMPLVFTKDSTIVAVRVACGTSPTLNTIFDVNISGTSIFTNQANRPVIVSGTKIAAATTPDITAVPAGAVLTVDVDQTTGCANAALTVELI
jgi:hypothetical protein